jgi:hypothetical protein
MSATLAEGRQSCVRRRVIVGSGIFGVNGTLRQITPKPLACSRRVGLTDPVP